jgi:Protein of unknown function (DUF2937)
MVWFSRTAIIAAGIAGGVVTSQAPEFAQQYRQRLGGALEELRAVVEDFDADAKNSALSRSEALSAYSASTDRFLRDRGLSVGRAISRYESLRRQAARFAEWPPAARPIALLGETDAQLAQGTWQDFKPALPVTITGGIWAAAGALLGGLLALATARIGRGMVGARRRRGLPATRQAGAAYHAEVSEDVPSVMPERDGPVGGRVRS